MLQLTIFAAVHAIGWSAWIYVAILELDRFDDREC